MKRDIRIQRPRIAAAPRSRGPLGKVALRLGLAGFFVAHIPLGLLVYHSPIIAKVHALMALGVGLILASRGRQPERVACAGAYIIGAEVLWRMAGADIFWEFGKYSLVAIFLLAIFRGPRVKVSVLPLIYFALLIPSAMLLLYSTDLADARREISFNLSGPLALAVSAWFFSTLKMTPKQLQRVFLTTIGPLVGVAFVTLFATMTNPEISFGGESNVASSAGFGPNQVSAALGLGVLLALLCVLDEKANRSFRFLMFGVMIFLGMQSALTFSRGGLYNAAGAALVASLYLLKDARSRIKLFGVAAGIFLAANFLILPALDSFTGGALSARFQDADLTNRDEIVWQDLAVWQESPVFGVGPGESREYQKQMFPELSLPAHTEFSRVVAEHGVFGLAAILLLLVGGVQNIKRARNDKSKAIVVALMMWSFLFMLNAAMRLSAASFMLGLAFISLVPAKKALLKSVWTRPAHLPPRRIKRMRQARLSA